MADQNVNEALEEIGALILDNTKPHQIDDSGAAIVTEGLVNREEE